jgi:hypothetical protein
MLDIFILQIGDFVVMIAKYLLMVSGAPFGTRMEIFFFKLAVIIISGAFSDKQLTTNL